MTDIAAPLNGLRIAVAEVEALTALAVHAFDDADWHGADQQIVERMGSVLGVIARSAASTITAFNRLHSAIADAQPATAGERWDYNDGTASGG
jgi:hypothetical protein